MTGYRAGFAAGPPELIAALKLYRPLNGTAVPEFIQRASMEAWGREDHVEAMRAVYAEKRALFMDFFRRQGVRIAGSEATFYLWCQVPDAASSEAFANRLLEQGVVVAPAVARYGSFLSEGVIQMPSYVNIGAWVGPGTMVDTWATVGSCAQIGARVHLAGGVGIGGVLEPVNARPVIVEDDAFIGSRAIVTEGVVVGAGAILGANVVLTASTPVVDVTGSEPVEHRGAIPPNAVVVPGTRVKKFPAGEFGVATGLIIGWRSARQESRVSLNDALREFGVSG